MGRSSNKHRQCRCHGIPCVTAKMVTLIVALWGALLVTSTDAEDPAKASTSRAAREDAIRGIPFASLSSEAKTRISSVVNDPTMFRRMPVHLIECDPEMHRFLIRYPEVVVNVWQIMGITQVSADRIAPYKLKCDDGVGTLTDLELIYGDRSTHIIFAEGTYEGPMFRNRLHGRCVLVLKSAEVGLANTIQISNRLDVFVQIDHIGVDIMAKTLHPLLGKSADVNFRESLNFLQRMSVAAKQNGPGMHHLADRLDKVEPSVKLQFKSVIDQVDRRDSSNVATLPASSPLQLPLTAASSARNPGRVNSSK